MQHYIICPNSGGLFLFSDFNERTTKTLLSSSALYKIIYNYGEPIQIDIGASKKILYRGNILFCKPLQSLEVVASHTDLRVIAFNKDFYNLKTKEEETEFYGFWYYSFTDRFTIALNDVEQSFFHTVFNNIEQELIYTNGSLVTQRDILKRIIRITNIKLQTPKNRIMLENKQLEIIKRFSQLVEAHFKKKTNFEDIVKTLPKNQSFLHRLIFRHFQKYNKPQNRNNLQKKLLPKTIMKIKSKVSEEPRHVLVNSKLNTRGII